VLWVVLCRTFFLRKAGFAIRFLKTLFLTWAFLLGSDCLRAFILGTEPGFRGYGSLVFGVGIAQWLLRSPRVEAVFVR
jgi:hypothetical protein